ncbi:MarR family winged helix-turn-helix transcriptional regulator [Phytomonospora sp. NPDC050363]|uniref:MarR family winged helix-turn-helix transcriptional regulator n=1 Tax=Phytomonospora sp. NPDC050363 TaxID=3155642 RepID=UPI0033DCBAF0
MQETTRDTALEDDLRNGLRGLLKTIRLLRRRWTGAHTMHPGVMPMLAQIEEITASTAGVGCHLKDVAEALALDTSTVSRSISGLVAQGLVERVPDASDRRACLITLTSAGVSALASSRDWYDEVFAETLAGWDRDELRAFAAQMLRVTDDVAHHLASDRPSAFPRPVDPKETA